MSEIKNPLDGIDGWLDIAAEIIDELEDIAIQTVEYETESKRLKIQWRRIRELCDNFKQPNIYVISQEEKRKNTEKKIEEWLKFYKWK